jgi:hypothetical protein
MALVELASSATDFHRVTEQAEQRVGGGEELLAHDEATPTEIRAGSPITGPTAINFAAIEQGIDNVFDRIERLGDDLVGRAGATRFAEWLVIAGGACAAFEYVRVRFREGTQWQAASHWSVPYEPHPYEPRLRRRWFRGRGRR